MTRLILFLIRRKLGVKKCENFRFTNQKNKEDTYYFYNAGIRKVYKRDDITRCKQSNVSLNWLLDPNCEIEKV